MVSDILTLDFCEASLSSTLKWYFNTLNLWYWWIVQCLKQWLMCMFTCAFTNLNTHTCDQNKLMSNIFLSYLQLHIMNISFVSLTCISHCKVCFSNESFSCCYEMFLQIVTHPTEGYVPLQCQDFHGLLFLYQKVRVMKFVLYIFCS
jgi:hypothetical protein